MRTGGVTTTAVRISAGWTHKQLSSRLAAKYGPLEPDVEQQVLVAANRGIESGDRITNSLASVAAESIGAADLGLILTPQGVSIGVLSDILGKASDLSGSGMQLPISDSLGFQDFAYLADLYADNPEAWRALAVAMISGSVSGNDVRMDLQLSGGETWKELVERAINWRLIVEHNYPDRFEDMEEEEVVDLSLRVIAGWRKW